MMDTNNSYLGFFAEIRTAVSMNHVTNEYIKLSVLQRINQFILFVNLLM